MQRTSWQRAMIEQNYSPHGDMEERRKSKEEPRVPISLSRASPMI
jgi:hypothetical protein